MVPSEQGPGVELGDEGMVMVWMRKDESIQEEKSNKNIFLFLSFVFVLSLLLQECKNDENNNSRPLALDWTKEEKIMTRNQMKKKQHKKKTSPATIIKKINK